ncbi:MAG: GNAT family N-acetyltransferase [Patescibacteria group bacterium]
MAAKQETLKHTVSIHLEPVQHTRETLASWVTWINDPDIRKWMWNDLPTKAEDINQWLYNAANDPRRHYFSIVADGKLIGFVNLRQDHAPSTTGEIGIVIGEKEYQSRGIGTMTVAAIHTYAKEVVGLTGIRAMIKPTNEKSIKLFTSQGYVPQGNVTIEGVTMTKFVKSL